MANPTASMDGFVPELGISAGAVALPLLSLITIVLDMPSLIWYVQHRNLPGGCLVFWIILSNILNIINAFIWPNDNIPDWYDGKGLCDIEVKLDLAMNIALVGSIVCIMRTLAQALDTKRTAPLLTASERQRRKMLECFLCFGLPVYMMCVHYIVQPSRYYIFAISGCTTSVDNSWPVIPLLYIWPVIFGLIAAYYSVLVIYRMHRYRRNFGSILQSSSSGLTAARFRRLFAMAIIIVAMMVPVLVYILYENVSLPMQPYSWDRVHAGIWDIIYIPTDGSVIFDRWIRIAAGFIVFACFGFANDAVKMYKGWLRAIGMHRICSSFSTDRPASNASSSSLGNRTKKYFTKKLSQGMASSSASQVSTHGSDSSPAIEANTVVFAPHIGNKSVKEGLGLPSLSAKIKGFFTRKKTNSDLEKGHVYGLGIYVEEKMVQHVATVNAGSASAARKSGVEWFIGQESGDHGQQGFC